jgi:hypothetical protein
MLENTLENRYKRVALENNVEVSGYKSRSYFYSEGEFEDGKLNNDIISLIIKDSSFKLEVNGRENLLKLKEALDFALEIDDD